LPFSAQERDIDLLLIELLHVSPIFAKQFTERLGLVGATIESVWHSVYREHGETDVLLIVGFESQRAAVMIEDKIGAPMQPDQCERYHLRGEALCAEGTVDRYHTVLCAPAGYLRGVSETERWDIRISLEEVAGFVAATAFHGWEWKEAVLVAAAAKQTRAREADSRSSKAFDAIIAPLKNAYRAFVLAQFPFLTATRQEGRDREYFIGAVGLPPGIRFKHAFFRGEVSLIFERAWAGKAEETLSGGLPEGAWAVRHGSEFHIRTSVEVMDPLLPFDQQEEVATQALEKIAIFVPLAQSVAEQGM
jgi:hypothetical protein